MVRRLLIAFTVMALGAVFVTPAVAQASITGETLEEQHEPPNAEDGWQAVNCTTNTPECSPSEPNYFTQAGGHPVVGITQEYIKHPPKNGEGKTIPSATLKDIRVELPVGLTVNPESAKRCALELFTTPAPACSLESKVGEEEVTVSVVPPPFNGVILPPEVAKGTKVNNYDLEPKFGEPALFGFVVGGAEKIFLETEVAWDGDYHESFSIRNIPASAVTRTLISRLVNLGRAGTDETFITNPTTCFSADHYSTLVGADSYEHEDPATTDPTLPNSGRFEAGGVSPTGCDLVPFDPSLKTDAGTNLVDSPAPATVNTELPYIKGGEEISESHLRNAKITLPAGMGLNPAASNGLQACTDEQFGKGTRNPANSCPSASKIGTAEIETPPFPAGALKGDIYLGQQLSNDPTSGEEFRLLVEAGSDRYGIHVRLIGHTSADPQTGQLTTTLSENPQVPFTAVKLRFDGSKSVLTSPPTCATATSTSTMEPWSTPDSTKSPTGSFTLSSVPGGGSCPTTLAGRAFAPSYTGVSDSAKGGAYSPFRVHIGRPDGQQELKGINVTLPKGLTAKLAGVPYCSNAALAAAAESTGGAEQALSRCQDESMIGTASTEAGTGSDPVKLAGKAYLAGPYEGAPLSMAIVTPAVSGPFDLGTVVVRVALNVNPETAQVNAVSDAIPDVFGGVKLDLRSVNVNLDKSMFMRNPTNCAAQATTGALNGGGSDPTNPAAFSSYAVNAPYQATDCSKLGFKPKLHTRLTGPTTRNKNPRIRAILEAREGDANLSRAALTLPHSVFLDQSHIKTVCTRVQLASQTCPAASVYGHAEAKTPLLGNPLKGPVYLVSSNHTLPDLVADLRGQINVQVHGVISSKRGGIKTVFSTLPDVPVKKFILNMEGGKKSLLVNSKNLCKSKQSSVMNLKAQNGKQVKNNKLLLKVSSCH
ncbi:MAG TPA: hypothetical protein VII45_06615 [Solirubrobacterales bacterium]